VILRAYARGTTPPFGYPPVLSVNNKPKGTVLAADLAVNKHLVAGLSAAYPTAPFTLVNEERIHQCPEGEAIAGDWTLRLDPLDGTQDFLRGTGKYAVHLTLVHGRRAVIGVVLQPELEQLWFGLLRHPRQPGTPLCQSPGGIGRSPGRLCCRAGSDATPAQGYPAGCERVRPPPAPERLRRNRPRQRLHRPGPG
jgi:hypothetical protein